MYDKLKGYARRTTQRIREKVSSTEPTPTDTNLINVTQQIEAMNTCSDVIQGKVTRVNHLLDELGVLLEEIGSVYKSTPCVADDSRKLAEQLQLLGQRVHRFNVGESAFLRENVYEVLSQFNRECQQLSMVEGNRRVAQLEHDYFKIKLENLRSAPTSQDCSRIPRNEKILESWRVELWRATEENKMVCSQLYNSGKRAIDKAVYSVVQSFSKFVHFLETCMSSELDHVQLPEHVNTIVLPPSTISPSPTHAATPHGNDCSTSHSNSDNTSTTCSTQSASVLASTHEHSSENSFSGVHVDHDNVA